MCQYRGVTKTVTTSSGDGVCPKHGESSRTPSAQMTEEWKKSLLAITLPLWS